MQRGADPWQADGHLGMSLEVLLNGYFPRGIERLARGRLLVTLQDAGNYITKLPKAEHEAAEWQGAMEALIPVAKLGGPTMFARIGMMRALNRGHVREFNPTRKDPHWGTPQVGARPMKTVWIYVDTRKQVGDRDHIKVFASPDLADEWFVVNDPEGVVFEYEVIGAMDDETGQGR